MNSPINNNPTNLHSFVTDTTHAIDRLSVPALDAVLGHQFGVLDHVPDKLKVEIAMLLRDTE